MTGLTLTPREAEIAALVAQGHGYPTIARRLGISRHTVRSHIVAIARKLPAGAGTPRERVVRWILIDQRKPA